VRLVLPFAPGGSTDLAARAVGPKLGKQLGQSVIVDNRTGAGGLLALTTVARGPQDGHSFAMAAAGVLTISPHLNPTINHDVLRELVPVTGFARTPVVLIANSAFPASNIADVLKLAKEQPGKLSVATGGNGTVMHLGMELLQSVTGTSMVHVPYRGSLQATMAAMGGETPLAVVDLTSALGRLETGKIKVIGVMSKERTSLMPNLPTLLEGGVTGFDVSGWFGVLAPASTPPAVVAKLNRELTALLRTDELKQDFKPIGMEPMPTSPEQLGELIKSESARWAAVIKRAGIKGE
jgi:tripartite-type tricarboxylate transporter receptor subunit TctC